MPYIDGFVAAVPTANRQAFIDHATVWAEWFRKRGALAVRECWGDDVPEGEVTSFPLAVKRQEGETVVLSWIEWPDKATRDAAMAAIMEDPEMKPHFEMPFDGKRMIFGGFEPVVTL